MGIKDNFQQALRELTGTEKEDTKRDKSVDAIKNAVSAGDGSDYDTMGGNSFDEIQRRASAAAEEMTRQQSAYLDVTYRSDDSAKTEEPDEIVMDPINGGNDDKLRISQFENDAGDSRGSGYTGADSAGVYNGRYSQSSERANPYDRYGQRQTADPYAGGQYQGGSYGSERQTPRPGQQPSSDSSRAQIFSAARYNHNKGSEDDEMTVISRNTVIDGNVRSFANMSIDGNVKGNVETTKDVDINGKIVGNIACNNAQMRTSQIQGNVQMKGNVYMERDTLLIGDLSSTYADINGKIKGNVAITGKAELKSDAVIFGDISASTITVNDGAIIQGYVSTTFLNKEDSKNIFPDTITIGE